MPRFRKGTTDHDSNGKMGGSMPTKKKAATAAKTTAKRKAKKADPTIAAEAVAMASTNDPQSGGAMVAGPAPDAKAVIKHRQEAVADQFAAADAVAEATLSRQIRGY